MPKHDRHTALITLIELGHWRAVFELLELTMRKIHDAATWQALRLDIAKIPKTEVLKDVRHCEHVARVLRGARDVQAGTTLVQEALELYPQSAALRVEWAWLLSQNGQYEQASQLLHNALPNCSDIVLGLAFRVLGRCENALGLDAQITFEKAHAHLRGRDLGLCLLEQASTLGETQDTRALYAKAEALLQKDAYHLAWLNYNWGMLELRSGMDALFRLQNAEKLARKPAGRAFLPRTLCGLAAWWRFNGELERAESRYREAVRKSQDQDDLEQGLWGLGQTLRLSQRFGEALSAFERAYEMRQSRWLQPSIAATQISMGLLKEAQTSLIANHTFEGITADRASITKAELARSLGNRAQAVEHVLNVNWSRAAQEEMAMFPKLHALAQALELPIAPIQKPLQNQVQVRTLGLMQVFVNGREINLPPMGRPAEILAFLLEQQQHSATARDIALALWPDLEPEAVPRKTKTVNEHVRALRKQLGWEHSVIATASAYTLDPACDWVHDAEQVRSEARQRYLNGIHSNWVMDTEQDINALIEELPKVERVALKNKRFG
jgi:tetratricopeptide (TPR) repeat protein